MRSLRLKSQRLLQYAAAVVVVTLLSFVFYTQYSKPTHLIKLTDELKKDAKLGENGQHVLPPNLSRLVEINSNKEMNQKLVKQTAGYVEAIVDSDDNRFSRLECPLPRSSMDRYQYLKAPGNATTPTAIPKPKYFFSLDLYNVAGLLPQLIGTILNAARFLGPENCVLSIVEGRSTDGTFEILRQLAKETEKIGLRYILTTDELDPKGGQMKRIEALAILRNLALKDLWEHTDQYDKDAMVIFVNDVSLCFDDVLELIHQHNYQGADMLCAMDWQGTDPKVLFYDEWIARTITGDTFYEIIPETKDKPWQIKYDAGLFWNHEKTRTRYKSSESFQVFACWNGMVTFTAKPIMEEKIKFRSSNKGECHQGEPDLFAKDLWYHGYGKIGVVPSINLAYSIEDGVKVRAQKGYVSKNLARGGDSKIEWQKDPPEKILCLPDLGGKHHWIPWNLKLPGGPQEGFEGKD